MSKGVMNNMKIICSKSNLLYGVNIVSKAVPTRTTMAILECILIDASAGEIKLTANDMELGIETKIEGEIEERGIIALDAKVFSDIVRKLPDNEVVIETDSSFKTTITCEKQNSISLENPVKIFLIFHILKEMKKSPFHSLL